MPPVPVPDALETDQLLLRRRRVEKAEVTRGLWTSGTSGCLPTGASTPRADRAWPTSPHRSARRPRGSGRGSWAWSGRARATSSATAGWTTTGNGPPGEPELAFELLRAVHGWGYAIEAGQAVVTWADEAGYPMERDPVHGETC